MQLVVHAPFGAKQNRAFGLALRKRFCRTFDFELQAAATDEGILLSMGPQNSFPLESIFEFLAPGTIDEILTQAALRAPMWGVRWRWNATRSLAVLRSRAGKKIPFNILRMRTDDLLAQVFPAQAQCQEHDTGVIEPPDHPLIRETLRDCLNEAMDIEGLRGLLQRMERGELRLLARDTAEPSPLSHEILNSAPYAYLDDAPLEERRSRAVQLRRTLDPGDAASLGALDAAAIAEVVAQAAPDLRSADELHDLLLTLVLLPAGEAVAWQTWLEELRAAGRAVLCDGFWRASERSGAELLDAVRGWVGLTGPITAPELAPGHLFVPFHYGCWDEDKRPRAANELTIAGWDPVSKQPHFKYAAVKLKKVSKPSLAQPESVDLHPEQHPGSSVGHLAQQAEAQLFSPGVV